MREVAALPGAADSKCDQCIYNCRTAETPNSQSMAARKATRFLSNSAEMLGQLERRCDGTHEHKHLRGKDLAEAAFYPAELVHSIIKGMNLTHAADIVKRALRNDAKPDSLYSSRVTGYGKGNKVLGTCRMKMTAGGAKKIVYNELNFKKPTMTNTSERCFRRSL